MNCPKCKRHDMSRVSDSDQYQPEYLCIHCGQQFFPVKLDPISMSRIQFAIEQAEQKEKQSARKAFESLKLRDDQLKQVSDETDL